MRNNIVDVFQAAFRLRPSLLHVALFHYRSSPNQHQRHCLQALLQRQQLPKQLEALSVASVLTAINIAIQFLIAQTRKLLWWLKKLLMMTEAWTAGSAMTELLTYPEIELDPDFDYGEECCTCHQQIYDSNFVVNFQNAGESDGSWWCQR